MCEGRACPFVGNNAFGVTVAGGDTLTLCLPPSPSSEVIPLKERTQCLAGCEDSGSHCSVLSQPAGL